MFGYTEGERALESNSFFNFEKDHLIKIRTDTIDEVTIGTDIFFAGHHKKWQNIYRVMDIQDNKKYILRMVTKTGKLSNRKSRKANIALRKDDVQMYCYIAKETAYQALKKFKENEKRYMRKKAQRDYQRSKVYRAENAVRRKFDDSIFISTKAAEDYLKGIFKNPEIKKMNPSLKTIKVEMNNRMKNKADACHWNGTIRIAGNSKSFGLSKLVLLHEFAHLIAPGAQHGPEFTAAYLKLLQIEVPEVFPKMVESYNYYGIDFNESKFYKRAANIK